MIFLLGAYGQDNLGDETILKVFLEFFRDRIVTVASSNPEKTRLVFNVNTVHIHGDYKGKLRSLLNSDFIIFGGGSLLKELTLRSCRWRYSVLFNVFIGVFLAKLLRKKIFFSAIGVGPLKNAFSKLLAKLSVHLVDLVTVRDCGSKKLLENIGINRKIIIVSDPSFLIEQRKQGILSKYQGRGNLTVGICPLYNLRDDISYKKIIQVISEFCDWLINKYNAKILLIPFQSGYNFYNDIVVNEDIYKRVINKLNIFKIGEIVTIEKMLKLFSNIDVILGIRYHSLIYAILKNIPFIAITYDEKVENFLSDINWEYYIEDNKMNFNELVIKFENLMKNREEVLKRIKNIKLLMISKAELNFNLMQQYIKKRAL